MFFGIAINAMPEFVLGMLLILLFSAQVFHLLPAVALLSPGQSSFLQLPKIILPVMTLVLLQISCFYRLVRATMIDVLSSDYVEFARLKGMPLRTVLWRHAVRNGLVPAVQAVGTLTVCIEHLPVFRTDSMRGRANWAQAPTAAAKSRASAGAAPSPPAAVRSSSGKARATSASSEGPPGRASAQRALTFACASGRGIWRARAKL
ncbi:hypothetical protein C5F48_19695 [Cereibacter changlensis JA139]|uniref:ABC transmembrane type-1 domain-containing protein n=1 Tax=Cereibacter changlensis JA139 TaxID=1188249 RepID=A0A2T4JQ68_9RHOB|nr:hypothetical protein C5F48_19695 [Cereibacter changlensis JA139]